MQAKQKRRLPAMPTARLFPAAEQMIRYRPAVAIDFLQGGCDNQAFRRIGSARGGGPTRSIREVIWQLSGDIFSRARRAVVADLWDMGFGKLSFLKRLADRILLRRQYDQLVTTLLDPQLRDLLHQCSKISPSSSRS